MRSNDHLYIYLCRKYDEITKNRAESQYLPLTHP